MSELWIWPLFAFCVAMYACVVYIVIKNKVYKEANDAKYYI